MADNIQRFPGGLLELLSAKLSGWTPGEIGRDVFGSIDMLQFFAQTAITHETVAGAAVAEGGSVVIVVPSTEWWLLFAANMDYEKTATMSMFAASIRINPTSSLNWVAVASGPTANPVSHLSTAASNVTAVTFVPDTPWILAPGTQIFGRVDILGADATVAVGVNCRVARLT